MSFWMLTLKLKKSPQQSLSAQALIGGGSQMLTFLPGDTPSEYSTQSGLGVPTGGVASQSVREKLKKAFKLSDSQMEHLVELQRPLFQHLAVVVNLNLCHKYREL